VQYLAHAAEVLMSAQLMPWTAWLFDTLIIQTSPTRKNTIKNRYKNYEAKSWKSANVCGVSQ